MANICNNLEQDLKALNMSYAIWDDYMNDNIDSSEATSICIYITKDSIFDMKTFNLPKTKLVDIEWIMNKVNKDKVFVNFTKNFKKILPKIGLKNSINVYAASYGIGIFVLFNYRHSNIEIKNKIEKVLNEANIEYRTELSGASWVFRFVISKKAENIEKLNNFFN